MITGELKRQVDKIWDTLWTAGIISPVTVMEQITYLLFMKLLADFEKSEREIQATFAELKEMLR